MKKAIIIIFCTLFALPTFCQIGLVPTPSYASDRNNGTQSSRSEDDTSRLRLPFFEDFSKPRFAYADPARFQQGGGSYINNTLSLNPPSMFVASLDGINQDGLPYNITFPESRGEGDKLESNKMDFSKNIPEDNIVMSFYWQAQGLGEKPDEEDYIQLDFLDSEGNWVKQWQRFGGNNPKDFNFQGVAIREKQYLHANFQFRFQIFCRQSGMFDVWHIDYILIAKQRSAAIISILDIAASGQPTPFLRNYRAMPIEQFYTNPRNEIRDSIFSIVGNQDNRFNIISCKAELYDAVTKRYLGLMKDSSYFIREFQRDLKVLGLSRKDTLVPRNSKRLVLETRFTLNTKERDDYLPPINFRKNDTISGFTVLDNYYAYDDGSAEYGIAFNQRFGKVAVEHKLNVPATLTHIDFYFVPIGMNVNGENFSLMVWKKLDVAGGGAKDSVIHRQTSAVHYSDSLNKFIRITLEKSLRLDGTFFIGIEQLSTRNIVMGFDLNTDFGTEKIWQNVANEWLQNKRLRGSIMLRPIFGVATVVGLDDELEASTQIKIYPNPTDNMVHIDGAVKHATLFDAQGRLWKETTFDPNDTQKTIDLSQMPKGLYLLRLNGKTAHKIIKE